MTTFWVSFSDPDAPRDQRFLGVAIIDMDETGGECTWGDVIERCWELGINPGGGVFVQTVKSIPDEHKNKLITDEALLMKLGSRGRAKANVN